MFATSLRYHLLAYRRDQLWLPAGLWALFAIIVLMFRGEARVVDMASNFLGIVLPLMAGVLSAAALVDDPAIELQLAAPRRPFVTLMERLGLLLAIVAVAAVAFQLFLLLAGVDLASLGNPMTRQLVWLVPSLAFVAVATITALAFAHTMAGVLVVGALWILQVIFRGWFAADPWARYLFLFTGSLLPQSPDLRANQFCLLALALAFLAGAALLLRSEERYL